MNYRLFLALTLILLTNTSFGQTRIFREVTSQISRQVKPVVQNDQFVGYVILDQLEKASKDSFNYKLSFLDENLNDIGVYSFRQCDLSLEHAVFEQDVFCLAYLESDIPLKSSGPAILSMQNKKGKRHLYTQFFNLQGNLINESTQPVDAINVTAYILALKNPLRVTNITGKGFAFVYGDGPYEYTVSTSGQINLFGKAKEVASNEHILVYNLEGKRQWHRILPQAKSLALNVTSMGDNIYTLRKCEGKVPEGDFELLTYQFNDSTKMIKKSLIDDKQNPLRVLGFRKALSGKSAYLAGIIVNGKMKSRVAVMYETYDYSTLTNGFYAGTFHFELNGENPVAHYAYWNDESMEPAISKKGCIESINAYGLYTSCFDDFAGNIYFAGTSISKRQRVTDFVPVLKHDLNGKLSLHSTCNLDRASLERDFLAIADEERQENFLVIEDEKKVDIYNLSNSKIVKTILRAPENWISVEVYKAKSGHIMVSEQNRKEHTVKLSIEAI